MAILSDLPDELLVAILSILPTRLAARTSVLSHRFRNIWQASQSVELNAPDESSFVAMADSAILRRNPTHTLLSLDLELCFYHESLGDPTYVSTILAKAHALGLRHLVIRGGFVDGPTLKMIFSIDSLISLSIVLTGPFYVDSEHQIFPSGSNFKVLTSLFMELYGVDSQKLSQLLNEIPCLKQLHLNIRSMALLSFSSRTIKLFNLTVGYGYSETDPKLETFELLSPSLNSFTLATEVSPFNQFLLSTDLSTNVNIPVIKVATLSIESVNTGGVTTVNRLLGSLSHVETLNLTLLESLEESHPFPLLLEPGMPVFASLKHLTLKMSFHRQNLESLVALLNHSPFLETLDLVDEVRNFFKFVS